MKSLLLTSAAVVERISLVAPLKKKKIGIYKYYWVSMTGFSKINAIFLKFLLEFSTCFHWRLHFGHKFYNSHEISSGMTPTIRTCHVLLRFSLPWQYWIKDKGNGWDFISKVCVRGFANGFRIYLFVFLVKAKEKFVVGLLLWFYVFLCKHVRA